MATDKELLEQLKTEDKVIAYRIWEICENYIEHLKTEKDKISQKKTLQHSGVEKTIIPKEKEKAGNEIYAKQKAIAHLQSSFANLGGKKSEEVIAELQNKTDDAVNRDFDSFKRRFEDTQSKLIDRRRDEGFIKDILNWLNKHFGIAKTTGQKAGESAHGMFTKREKEKEADTKKPGSKGPSGGQGQI